MSAISNSMNNANNEANRSRHRASSIDISKIKFGEIVTNKYGGKSSPIQYNGEPLYIQTPRMKLPYGLSMNIEKDKNGKPLEGKSPKYSLQMSFAGFELDESGEPANPKIREFYDFLIKLHELLVKTTHKNAASWLGLDECNEAIAKAFVRDTVRVSKDKQTKKPDNKYPPTFTAKVKAWNDKFMTLAFDENKNPITDFKASIVSKCEVRAMLKLTCVNLAQGKCGYSFDVEQVMVYKPASLPSYAFLDDDESETVPVKSNMPDPEESSATQHNTHTADSDDETDALDGGDDDEEEQAPLPPPTKKVVKTSAAPKVAVKTKKQ
jgi:hypothetical protein